MYEAAGAYRSPGEVSLRREADLPVASYKKQDWLVRPYWTSRSYEVEQSLQ